MSRARRGGAAAEFALVVPVLVLWLMGTMELGRALSLRQVVVAAAHDGARAAGRSEGSAGDPTADLVALAEASAGAVLADAGIACGAGCTVVASSVTTSGVKWIEIVVTVPYSPAIDPRWAPTSITATAVAPFRRQR